MQTKLAKLSRVPKECNSNNHKAYRPYIVTENTLTIDPEWYENDLLQCTRDAIQIIAERYTLTTQFEPVTVPHEEDTHQCYGEIYAAFLEQYNFDKWLLYVHQLMTNGVQDIPLTEQDIIYLEKKTKLCMTTSYKISMEDRADFSFIERLKSILNECDNGAFVKLTNTSSKNEQVLKPLDTVTDVLSFLTRTEQFYYSYADIINKRYCFSRTQSIIIMPWNDSISKDTEFRVFIYRKNLVAISQQHWYDRKYFSDDHCNKIAQAIHEFSTKLTQCVPFSSVVLDVWVDSNYTAHLIECNPFGAFHASGSSLFHWVNDYSLLHSDGQVVHLRCILAESSAMKQ
jgi:hypothetical protein